MKKFILFTILVFSLCVFTTTSFGTDYNFGPSDDTYVQSSASSTNYGTEEFMKVKSDQQYSYVKFTVSGVSGTITAATLKLHANMAMSNTSAYAVTGTWAEGTITWANDSLSWGGSPLDTVTGISAGTWYDFDVTSAVSGDGTYTFGLKTTDTEYRKWDTKESAYDPILVVTVSGGTTVTKATVPNPSHGATNVAVNATLSWSPGEYAALHDVFLGTNFNNVNEAYRHFCDLDGSGQVDFGDVGVMVSQVAGPQRNR